MQRSKNFGFVHFALQYNMTGLRDMREELYQTTHTDSKQRLPPRTDQNHWSQK